MRVFTLGICIFACLGAKAEDTGKARADIADRALQSAMENLLVLHHLHVVPVEDFESVINVQLDRHLRDLEQNQSAIEDPDWRISKIRVLNAIGLIWAKNPPAPIKIAGNEELEQAAHAQRLKSIELIRWAMDQCKEHPEYECKLQ